MPRLFLIPYAGGNCYAYRSMETHLADSVDWQPLELPGRGRRMHDALLYTLEALSDDILDQVTAVGVDMPYAFFGHSMGGLLAWLVTHRLCELGLATPQVLFISGCRAPACIPSNRARDQLPRADFYTLLDQLGGIPKAVMADSALMALFEPILRADFHAVDHYQHRVRSPLNLPIIVFAGMDDPEVGPEAIEAWRQETQDAFIIHRFAGDHFFFHSAASIIAQLIKNRLF